MKKLVCCAMIIMIGVLFAGCFGPNPVVREYSLHAPTAGSNEPYKVEVLLGNDGPGGGEVVVQVDLSNTRTGEIIAQELKDIDLQHEQSVRTELDLTLPPTLKDLDPSLIDVSVEAHYPIE